MSPTEPRVPRARPITSMQRDLSPPRSRDARDATRAAEPCVLLNCSERAAPNCCGTYQSAVHNHGAGHRSFICQRCRRYLGLQPLPELNRLPPRRREETSR